MALRISSDRTCWGDVGAAGADIVAVFCGQRSELQGEQQDESRFSKFVISLRSVPEQLRPYVICIPSLSYSPLARCRDLSKLASHRPEITFCCLILDWFLDDGVGQLVGPEFRLCNPSLAPSHWVAAARLLLRGGVAATTSTRSSRPSSPTASLVISKTSIHSGAKPVKRRKWSASFSGKGGASEEGDYEMPS